MIWGWYGVLLHGPIPVMTPWYVFPAVASFLAVAGCLALTRSHLRLRLAGLLDGLLVLGAAFFVSWVLILRTIYDATPGSMDGKITALMPPAGNILFMAILIPIAVRVRRNQKLVVSFCITAVPILISNIVVDYAASRGPFYLGSPTDWGYTLTYVLAFMLMRRPSSYEDTSSKAEEIVPFIYLVIPYIPILIAGTIFAILIARGTGLDPVLEWLGLVIVAFGFIRQLIVLAENHTLSRDLSASEELYRHMALHDSLTGLPNRTLFYDRTNQLREFAKRSGAAVSILVIDLDGFKNVNDQYGHDAGDAVLQEVGMRLKDAIRASDTAARLGGDEFGIVLIGAAEAAENVAQRIRTSLTGTYALPGANALARIGASVGVATGSSDEPIDALIKRADHAMYVIKQEHHTG